MKRYSGTDKEIIREKLVFMQAFGGYHELFGFMASLA